MIYFLSMVRGRAKYLYISKLLLIQLGNLCRFLEENENKG
jgi:hypothetical protein